jgi:cob(I)alamin adenosyltransferase
MKIYTKTGDSGQTSLYGGKRVSKNNIRVNAYGAIDELNSLLGVISSENKEIKTSKFVNEIQQDLFLIGSYLAGAGVDIVVLTNKVGKMEEFIDGIDKEIPKLKNFILPKGNKISALFFYARAVARRSERDVVLLSKTEKIDDSIIVYLNRLSDLLFVFARYINHKNRVKESVWKINNN